MTPPPPLSPQHPPSVPPAPHWTISPEISLIAPVVYWLAPKLQRNTRQIIPFQVPTLVPNGFQIISGRKGITINLAFSSQVWPCMPEWNSGLRRPLAHSNVLFPGHLLLVLPASQDFFPPATRSGCTDIQTQSEGIKPAASSESVSAATKRGCDFVPGTDTKNKSWNLGEHERTWILDQGPF